MRSSGAIRHWKVLSRIPGIGGRDVVLRPFWGVPGEGMLTTLVAEEVEDSALRGSAPLSRAGAHSIDGRIQSDSQVAKKKRF